MTLSPGESANPLQGCPSEAGNRLSKTGRWDGGIYVDDKRFETPSAAAKAVTKTQSEAGWWFWLVNVESGESLSSIRDTYRSTLEDQGELEEDD